MQELNCNGDHHLDEVHLIDEPIYDMSLTGVSVHSTHRLPFDREYRVALSDRMCLKADLVRSELVHLMTDGDGAVPIYGSAFRFLWSEVAQCLPELLVFLESHRHPCERRCDGGRIRLVADRTIDVISRLNGAELRQDDVGLFVHGCPSWSPRQELQLQLRRDREHVRFSARVADCWRVEDEHRCRLWQLILKPDQGVLALDSQPLPC